MYEIIFNNYYEESFKCFLEPSPHFDPVQFIR